MVLIGAEFALLVLVEILRAWWLVLALVLLGLCYDPYLWCYFLASMTFR